MRRLDTNQGQDHFDLLPFIAILMCMIGCLLLVTISIATLSIGPSLGEGWIPVRNRQVNLKIPVLIEWDGGTAVVHREGQKTHIKWVPSSSLLGSGGENAEFDEFIKGFTGESATHYALFAVRPSGFDNFQRFAEEFRRRKIDVGYEPIKQEKAVRLLKEKSSP